jgi:hypothetical protein
MKSWLVALFAVCLLAVCTNDANARGRRGCNSGCSTYSGYSSCAPCYSSPVVVYSSAPVIYSCSPVVYSSCGTCGTCGTVGGRHGRRCR